MPFSSTPPASDTRPYVISWNLTYRCNLACEHCYLDAGRTRRLESDGFEDRRELGTAECLAIVDQIASFAPEAVLILTGGEPLLRRDILEIVQHAAARELWVVVGTNGVKITPELAARLKQEGVRGFALSLDALEEKRHDAFRLVKGAWRNTVEGAKILNDLQMPFIVQTTVGSHNLHELEAIAAFAHKELQAKVWNLYFLVQTGRGQFVSDITSEQYDEVLAKLSALQQRYFQRMMVNAKCAPHYTRYLMEREPDSPFLKTFDRGAGGCPAGTHYMGIRPNGDVTPCPYLPKFGGNLTREQLPEIWSSSALFVAIRDRAAQLGGRCGSCEFNRFCGGCRARAYGVTGDFLAEDPLCSYQPGTTTVKIAPPSIVYGGAQAAEGVEIIWEPAAEERIKRVPAFVRGMVMKAVESYCRREGLSEVTVATLDQVRAKMPTQKLFGRDT